MASGVAQQPLPAGDTLSQFTPPPVTPTADALKEKLVPVLATANTWGKGLAPPNGMVKLMGFPCTKAGFPTVTLTGTVTESVPDPNSRLPSKVPASTPPPGNRDDVMLIVSVEGAVPLVAEALNHPPPSAVVAVTVQLSVPVPAFRTCITCPGGFPPLVFIENASCPGMPPKNAADEGSMFSVTGTVIIRCWYGYCVR